MMLKAVPRKVIYWVVAALAVTMLLSAPTVVPSAHADCQPAVPICGG